MYSFYILAILHHIEQTESNIRHILNPNLQSQINANLKDKLDDATRMLPM